MRNFTIMALEERIVLDATLFNAADFVRTQVEVGQAVDLSGQLNGWEIFYSDLFLDQTARSGILYSDTGSPGQVMQVGIFSPGTNVSYLTFDPSAQSVTYGAPGVYHPFIDFNDPSLSNLVIGEITVVAPIDFTAPSIRQTFDASGQEGVVLTDQLLAKVYDLNGISLISGSSDNANIVLSNLYVEADPSEPGLYNVKGNIALNDVASGILSIKVEDPSANFNIFSVDVTATDAPLTVLGPVDAGFVKGYSAFTYVGSFVDDNINELESNYTVTIDWGDGSNSGAVLNSRGNGEYWIFGAHAYSMNPQGLIGTFLIQDGTEGVHSGSFNVVDATPVLKTSFLDLTINQGDSVNLKSNYLFDDPFRVVPSGAAQLLIYGVPGIGPFGAVDRPDEDAQLTVEGFSVNPVSYTAPGIYHVSIDFLSSDFPSLDVATITVLPLDPQLLWGVDENSNQLFSVADYAVAGAEGRVNLYGQLHTALGNVDGKVQAFTIDGADASGKNAAYIAISGLEDGLNNFSIGVIGDINDAANRTEVTLYKISGLKFDAQRDRITGLAVDPISGNLMGVVTRDGVPATLFVIDKNTLNSADHIAKGYTIGKIIGKDDLGGLKVTNARDLAFDENGNLFVTDGTKDKLYRISVGTGEILAVANMNEDNGVGEANIEALAWDPILNKMVGANALLNGGNDLVGLSLENGPNSIDVHLLQSLGDIQGMAFAPEFALRAGDDLGVLIDVARSEVEYEVGDGPMLLLRNVELVSFGEDTYDGGSLTVDVSGVDVNEFFAIKAGDGIKINAAGEVRYKGLWIGTIDALNNGKNGNALTVNFTANAGEKAVESLMQRITYLNTNSTLALGERIISFTIKDSLGAIIGYTTIDLQIEAEDGSHC